MHYGIDIATLGDYADPRVIVEFARLAESAGWEAIFVWDHLAFVWGVPSGDPWVILAAVAQATTRLKIGTAVTPVPRRRPQVLANTVATLDILSGGRVIFGAGLGGVPAEYSAFGEPDDAKHRAGQLDEALFMLARLWEGENVSFTGRFYSINDVTLAPLPVQRPRVPIWIGGESPAAQRRAARWDGWIIGGDNQEGQMVKTPQQVGELVTAVNARRSSFKKAQPLEVALTGCSQPDQAALVREYGTAGVTWWLESLHGFRGSTEDLKRRIKAGPPLQ